MRRRYLHFWLSLLLLAALAPVLHSQHLPLKFDWITLSVAYWVIFAAQSIFVAVLLALIGMPSHVLFPSADRHRWNWLRLLVVVVFFTILTFTISLTKSVILTVDAVALVELYSRKRCRDFSRVAAAILLPAAYLFFGFIMVEAYNCAIVSVRYSFATDPALAQIDRWLLHGHAFWEFTHWALRVFPVSLFQFLEFIYFGMIPQIGAAIILVALSEGISRSLQFVGTIMLAYYFALAMFYVWPAQGPFVLCPNHFSLFPSSLACYTIQKALIADANALYRHQPVGRILKDYFIACPSMHIVQPLVVLWFLRRWKRMVVALAIYDIVLVVAILFLEMHYLIDLIAGVPVAGLSIAICGRRRWKTG